MYPTDAREVLRTGEKQVAYFSSAPTMLGLMLRRGSWPDRALRLRRSYGAAPMPLSWAAEVAGRFGCKEIVHGYGLTEGGGWVTVQDPRTAADNEGSVGSLMPGHDALAVLRPDGTRAAAGEEGEVCLTGPGQMLEYVGMPEETARVVRGGWVRTGDLGELDAEGELRITGRIKDQINRGGLKIGAREVETVIEEIPGVTAVAAVGVSDPVLGERVAAMVEARDLAADRVREHVSRSLADYKTPSPVVVVSELPRNALGKPDKPRIRHILEDKG